MLIGLNGRLRSGKDTAAGRIEALVGDTAKVTRLAFADPLKNSAAALFGITREQLEAMKVDSKNTIVVKVPVMPGLYRHIQFTGRQYLERYGTEAHRDIFGSNFWLDQAVPPDFDHSDGLYLVTDCRFINEAHRIREVGGIVVEIIGPDGREGNGHPSDTPLPDELIDVYINNAEREDGYVHLDMQLQMVIAGLDIGGPDTDFDGLMRPEVRHP